MNDERAVPHLLPTSLVSLVPSLYAWQLYGWGPGIACWALTVGALVGMGWVVALREWPRRWLRIARVALIVLVMIALGLSAMEICTEGGVCRRAF